MSYLIYLLSQRFFSTVPHVGVTPIIKLFLLLLGNCNFAPVTSHNISI